MACLLKLYLGCFRFTAPCVPARALARGNAEDALRQAAAGLEASCGERDELVAMPTDIKSFAKEIAATEEPEHPVDRVGSDIVAPGNPDDGLEHVIVAI